MKVQLTFLLLLFCSLASAENQLTVKRSLGCKDYLSPTICSSLLNAVKHLNLLPSVIEDGIKTALANGNLKPSDIYNAVLDFLRNKVAGEECKAFLAPQMCDRIRNALSPWNLAKLSGKLVIESILKGPPTKYELFMRVLNAVRKELQGKRCDEILAAELCRKLKEMARKLLIAAGKQLYYLIEAAIAGYRNQGETYAAVVDFYRKDSAALRCSDILAERVCKSLNSLGDVFKISKEEISMAVKEAILKGKLALQEIIDDVKEFVQKIAKSQKCEDLLPAKYCSALRSIASKLKINAREVDEAIHQALKEGKAGFEHIKAYCEEYFKKHITCEAWLGSKTCGSLRSFAVKLGMKMEELEEKISEVIVRNQNKVSQIFDEVVQVIKEQIFG